MQCSDCGYISFKKEKACRSCGFKFKKSTQSSQLLAGKETFSIFAGLAKGQSEENPVIESVSILDEQEPAPFIDPETGDFNLDLPDTSEETINDPLVSSGKTEYQSTEFNIYEDIELEALEEVEGLGLEPLHATESLIEPENVTTVESIEEVKIDELEETIPLEPVMEIGEPRGEEVALDLDDNEEIVLGLDDNQSTPVAPPVAAAPLDEIELSLEIDDSDGPITIQNQDIPNIEIKDLGLELEQSDDLEPDKP
jgi:hypothetical protein